MSCRNRNRSPARPARTGEEPQTGRRATAPRGELVQVYEEAIRQLTLTNLDLREKVNTAAKVTTLPARR